MDTIYRLGKRKIPGNITWAAKRADNKHHLCKPYYSHLLTEGSARDAGLKVARIRPALKCKLHIVHASSTQKIQGQCFMQNR